MVLTLTVCRNHLLPFHVSKNLSSVHNSDLMQNPLIVPVKVLKGHKVDGELGRLTVTSFGISLRDEIKLFLRLDRVSDCVPPS